MGNTILCNTHIDQHNIVQCAAIEANLAFGHIRMRHIKMRHIKNAPY